MKRFALSVLLLSAAASAAADPTASPAKTLSAAQRLERLKGLAGAWEMDADADGKPDGAVEYRTTGGGSAVLETLFPGTAKEMLTLFTVDGDDLVLTHYCAMGNQPHMKAAASDDAARVAFAFTSGGNMTSRDEMHMDSLVVTFGDGKTFHETWTMWKDGKVVKTVEFDWKRKA